MKRGIYCEAYDVKMGIYCDGASEMKGRLPTCREDFRRVGKTAKLKRTSDVKGGLLMQWWVILCEEGNLLRWVLLL